MTRFVTGPARSTNALVLAITIGSTVAVGAAVSQLPTVLVGLISVAAYAVALEAFSEDNPVLTVVGSYLTLLAAVGLGVILVLSPVLAYEAYSGYDTVPNIVIKTALSAVAPWFAVGAVACALSVTTDGLRREAVWDSLDSLLYGLVVVGVGVLVLVSTHADEVALEAFGRAAVEQVRAVEGHNELTELGTVAVLAALATSLAIVVRELRRVERARSLFNDATGTTERDDTEDGSPERPDDEGDRLSAPASDANDGEDDFGDGANASVTNRFGEHGRLGGLGGFGGLGDRGKTGGAEEFFRRDVAVLAVPPGLLGAVLIGVGFSLGPGATLDAIAPGPFGIVGSVLGAVATAGWIRATLLWIVTVLALLRVSHFAMDWVIHFPWKLYRDRVVRATVPAFAVVAGIAFGPAIVETVIRTPSLHYVTVVMPDGTEPFFTERGLEMVDAPSGTSGFRRHSERFLNALRHAVERVGAASIVLAPVFGVVLLGSWVLLLGRYVAQPVIAAVSSDGVVAGWLLFGSALAGAILEVDVALVLLVGVGSFLVWDLGDLSRELAGQLDPDAETTRGELVRAGGIGLVVAVGVLIAIVGVRVTDSLALVESRPDWQLLVAMVCSVLGTVVALVYLSYRTE